MLLTVFIRLLLHVKVTLYKGWWHKWFTPWLLGLRSLPFYLPEINIGTPPLDIHVLPRTAQLDMYGDHRMCAVQERRQ